LLLKVKSLYAIDCGGFICVQSARQTLRCRERSA